MSGVYGWGGARRVVYPVLNGTFDPGRRFLVWLPPSGYIDRDVVLRLAWARFCLYMGVR